MVNVGCALFFSVDVLSLLASSRGVIYEFNLQLVIAERRACFKFLADTAHAECVFAFAYTSRNRSLIVIIHSGFRLDYLVFFFGIFTSTNAPNPRLSHTDIGLHSVTFLVVSGLDTGVPK